MTLETNTEPMSDTDFNAFMHEYHCMRIRRGMRQSGDASLKRLAKTLTDSQITALSAVMIREGAFRDIC
jgi:hypothetical protein